MDGQAIADVNSTHVRKRGPNSNGSGKAAHSVHNEFRISDNFSQLFLIIISINVDSNDAGICIIVTKWGGSQKPNFYKILLSITKISISQMKTHKRNCSCIPYLSDEARDWKKKCYVSSVYMYYIVKIGTTVLQYIEFSY